MKSTLRTPFDEPSLSNMYMESSDDESADALSDGSVRRSSKGMFQISCPLPQNEALLAEMPAESISKIQTQSFNTPPHVQNNFATRQSSHSSFHHSSSSKHHSPGNDPYGEYHHDKPLELQDPQETPSNAPTAPTMQEVASFSRRRSAAFQKTNNNNEHHRQRRRIHCCVICFAVSCFLLGVAVAVIGSLLHQAQNNESSSSSASALQRGSLPSVPIALPNATTAITTTPTSRMPTMSPIVAAAAVEMIPTTAFVAVPDSSSPPTVVPTDSQSMDSGVIESSIPSVLDFPTVLPTLWQTESSIQNPTIQPTVTPTFPPIWEPLEAAPVVREPTIFPTTTPIREPETPQPSFIPVKEPRTLQPTTTAPVRSPTTRPTLAPVKASATQQPGKKPKQQKRS